MSATSTVFRDGAQFVRPGSQTAATTAPKWAAAFSKWTTTAHGELQPIPLHLPRTTETFYRAGGIISENNFKFFIQFCMYAAFYCAFVLISCSYFTWEYRNKVSHIRRLSLDIITDPRLVCKIQLHLDLAYSNVRLPQQDPYSFPKSYPLL